MSRNARDLLNKLLQSENDSAIAEAKHWLDKNSDDKTAIKIINEIEYRTGNTEDILWCAQWLRNHTDRTELEKELGEESLVRVLVQEQRIQEKLGPESGRQLDKLLDLGVSESITILTRKWLVDFPDADYADFVLISLLRAKPSQQHIALARDWLTRNTNESTSDLVLAKLIECDGSPDLLVSATQSLKKFVEVSFTAQLACTVVKHAKDPAAQALAIDWCRQAIQGKQGHIVASMFDESLANHELAALVLSWCTSHPKNKWIGNNWNSVLFNAPSDRVFSDCWEWLAQNEQHSQWEGVFWFLLHAAAESSAVLPRAAVERAWQLWEKGNRRLVGVLLEADRSEGAAEKLFSWARSNPDDAKTTNTILSALLQVAPTEQVIEYSAEWIKSKQDLGFDSLAVLRPLLEKAPDADLIRMTTNLLDKAREPELIWSILELLIRTARVDSAITRAKQLLTIETTVAFRRSLDYSSGSLLLALFECTETTPSLDLCAKQWIEWHGHKYAELVASLEARLQN